MLKLLNSLIVFLSIFCLALPAMAEAPPLCWVDDGSGYYPDPFEYGDACVTIANIYDVRYAHETAPHAQKIQRGGWKLAAEFWNGTAASQEVIFHNIDTGDRFITSPSECYGYLFWNSCDADLWMGHNNDAAGNWDNAYLTWGIIGFTLRYGSLGQVIQAADIREDRGRADVSHGIHGGDERERRDDHFESVFRIAPATGRIGERADHILHVPEGPWPAVAHHEGDRILPLPA